jgi:hypothetical protein
MTEMVYGKHYAGSMVGCNEELFSPLGVAESFLQRRRLIANSPFHV